MDIFHKCPCEFSHVKNARDFWIQMYMICLVVVNEKEDKWQSPGFFNVLF